MHIQIDHRHKSQKAIGVCAAIDVLRAFTTAAYAFHITVLSLVLSSVTHCHAEPQTKTLKEYTTALNLYGGYANIRSRDNVFAPKESEYAHTISKLDWKANNVWVLGANGKLTIPKYLLNISLDGWSKVYAGYAKMVDRDYLNPDHHSQVTDRSIHPHTKLQTAFAIDFEIAKDFYFSRQTCSSWTFGALLGIKYIRFDWDVFGGQYSYSNGEFEGNFPDDLKCCAYKEEFTIPYIGLQTGWQCNSAWNLRLFGKYSPLGYVLCHDDHLLRYIQFSDVFRYAQYWIFGAEAVWKYSDTISVNLKYSYDHLNQATGRTKVKENGKTFRFVNVNSVENSFQLMTLGVTAKF